MSGRKEFGSSSSDSLNLSDAKKKRGRRGRAGDASQDDPFSLAVEDGDETKRRSKKRITFKLDNSDDDEFDAGSAEDLDGFGSGGRRGRTSRGKWLDGDDGNDGGREGYDGSGKDGTSRLGGGDGLIDPRSKLRKRRGQRGAADGLDSEGSGDLISAPGEGGGGSGRGDRSGSSSLLGTRLEQDGIGNGAGSGRSGTKTGRNRRLQNGTRGGDGSRDETGSQTGFDEWDLGTGTGTENRDRRGSLGNGGK